MKKSLYLVPVLMATLLSACATQGMASHQQHYQQGPTISAYDASRPARVQYGVVSDMRIVYMQGEKSAVPAMVGGGLGAAGGAALGSNIGKGNGKKWATWTGGILGGAMGASAGNKMAEDAARIQKVQFVVAFEVPVQTYRGQEIQRVENTISQDWAGAENIRPGTKVRVITYASGMVQIAPINYQLN